MTFTLSARLEDEMQAPLNFLSKHLKRSKSFLMGEALKSYIAEKMEEFEDAADGEVCLQRVNDEPISWDEAEKLAAEIRNV